MSVGSRSRPARRGRAGRNGALRELPPSTRLLLGLELCLRLRLLCRCKLLSTLPSEALHTFALSLLFRSSALDESSNKAVGLLLFHGLDWLQPSNGGVLALIILHALVIPA